MSRMGDTRWSASAVRSHAASMLAVVAALSVVLAVVAAARWVWALITNAGRGFDMSDEGYYLLSASHPAHTTATVSDFGFYLRPLLWLVGDSLRWYRVAGLALVLLACAIAASTAIEDTTFDGRASRRHRIGLTLAATALVSATALTYYGLWLPTPGYNLLNLTLMLLVAACLIAGVRALVDAHEAGGDAPPPRRRELWPFAVLGALLVVGATIKATSYVAAALVCAICLVVVAGRRVMPVMAPLVAGAIAGLALHWGMVAGPPARDVRRLWRGAAALDRLDSHTASELWQRAFLLNTVVPWFGVVGVGVAVLAVGWRFVRSPAARSALIAPIAAVAFVSMWRARPQGGPLLLSDDTGWWWVRSGVLALVSITALAPRRSRVLVVGPCVALLGVAASAGSNVGIVRQIGMTAGLIGLGVLVQTAVAVRSVDASHRRAMTALPAALFFVLASITSIGVLDDARASPYRLGAPLAASDVRIGLGRFGVVEVTPGTAAYLSGLQDLAGRLDDAQRACLIDLTGGTPSSAIALDARPAGAAWLLGGYQGSAGAVAYWLSLDDCVTGPIALLEAPGGRRSIPRPEWLSDRDLRVVGEVELNVYLSEVQVLSVAPAVRADG